LSIYGAIRLVRLRCDQ